MRPIILIGLMGAGKSILGATLAEKLQWPFLDLDKLIEEQESMQIAQIIETQGEAAFREIESRTLRNIKLKENFVLACGGGTPCFHGNMDYLNLLGTTLFLDPPLAEIKRRLSGEIGQRPLLQNTNSTTWEKKLEDLAFQRRPIYLKAALYIASTAPSTDEVIHMLKDFQ